MPKKKMTIIVSKGTLDMVYSPFILASTAAAMDMDVTMFFTFWGMDIVNKKKIDSLKFSPVCNPGEFSIPNIVAILPGMTNVTTRMLREKMKESNIIPIKELIKITKESGVKFLACQMTMDLLGIKKEDLIEEVDDTVGSASYLEVAADADINLFV